MLHITVKLRNSAETVTIDWFGARPVRQDLTAFLSDQYPGAEIHIAEE